MRDTLTIECLTEALTRYMDAANDEREARDAYDGCSWGYHGSSYIDAKARAAAELQDRLDAYIDKRVAATLKATLVHVSTSENP